jgi:hypothetical protein
MSALAMTEAAKKNRNMAANGIVAIFKRDMFSPRPFPLL